MNINTEEGQPLLKPKDPKRKAKLALSAALILTFFFMVGEIIGGYIAHSLAIMTDAAHLLTDIGAMLLSLFAMWLASRPPTPDMSFGFHRAEIIGALASVLTIWALTGVLVYEGILRVMHPEPVDGKIMFFIATGGLAINIIDAFILHAGSVEHSHGGHGHSHDHGHSHKKKEKKGHDHGHEHSHEKKLKDKTEKGDKEHKHEHKHKHGEHDHDEGHMHDHSGGHEPVDPSQPLLKPKKKKDKKGHEETTNINVYAAFIHVIGDCVQSIGVMAASALIWWKPHWSIADPIVTFIFSLIVLVTTVRLLRQSIAVLMEGVPQGITAAEVKQDLSELPGVTAIHDLHIWSLTVGQPALSVHLIVDHSVEDTDATLQAAAKVLQENYNISHTTIQIERVLACGTLASHRH